MRPPFPPETRVQGAAAGSVSGDFEKHISRGGRLRLRYTNREKRCRRAAQIFENEVNAMNLVEKYLAKAAGKETVTPVSIRFIVEIKEGKHERNQGINWL